MQGVVVTVGGTGSRLGATSRCWARRFVAVNAVKLVAPYRCQVHRFLKGAARRAMHHASWHGLAGAVGNGTACDVCAYVSVRRKKKRLHPVWGDEQPPCVPCRHVEGSAAHGHRMYHADVILLMPI